ncbi:MAG: fasciclin domain-containing protein [Candidatus Nanopelagicaceae bacterium]|nr:fasciclin domain-containing protein [Candidatus Nanopelagicaceae bacterium]
MKAKRSGVFAAVAVVLALTLSACGSDKEETMEAVAEETTEATTVGTIVDVASGAGNFGTLVAAVTAAELVETLSGEGPFTVFAPTDEAFAALPAGVVDALLLPENKAVLVKILTYHVVSGKVMAADVTDSDVATVEGQTVKLSTADGVTVNGAKVVAADVAASNGVIHAIDAVILPPGVDVSTLVKK